MRKIKFERLTKNLTQKELSEKTSIPASVISYLENGAVERICEELNIFPGDAFEEVKDVTN